MTHSLIPRCHRKSGFSLVELLVVLSIVSVLAALLLPAFLTVRGKAREIVCVSNLRQIGTGLTMYLQDYDGRYPFAVDPSDRAAPAYWSAYSEFEPLIPQLPLIQDVMQPYLKSPTLFRCPADTGFQRPDFLPVAMDASPSCYERYGTSYFYRTELAARRIHEASIEHPDSINVLLDPCGAWHGTLVPLAQRYNVLFADAHVKNVNRAQLEGFWATPLK